MATRHSYEKKNVAKKAAIINEMNEEEEDEENEKRKKNFVFDVDRQTNKIGLQGGL